MKKIVVVVTLMLFTTFLTLETEAISLHEEAGGITDAYIIADVNCTEYFDDDTVGRARGNLSDDWYNFKVSYGHHLNDDVNISDDEYTTSPNSLRLISAVASSYSKLYVNFSENARVRFIHFDIYAPTAVAIFYLHLQNDSEGDIFKMYASNPLGVAPLEIYNYPGAGAVSSTSDDLWTSVNISFNWTDYKANYEVNHVDCGWFSTPNNATNLASRIIMYNTGSMQNVYIENLTVDLEDITFFYEDRTWRDTATYSETNIVDITTTQNHTDDDEVVLIKVPVSSSVTGIVSVQNNTAFSNPPQATVSNTLAGITNNTYWYDATNQFVYIGTFNLTIGHHLNWTILCTYDLEFDVVTPRYLEVGDYFMATGHISNSTYYSLNGFIAVTRVYNDTFVDMLTTNPKWNCTNGNYQCTFSTYEIPPGIYNVSIELYYHDTLTYVIPKILYISEPGSGSYSDAVVYFNFYNTNFGLGLPKETLKVYVNGSRLNNDNLVYYTYTGNTINITVKDYYNTVMYWGNYTVNNTRTFLDLGLTFHSWLFGNLNDDYYMVSILRQGASRWWERGIVPYGEREFLIPSGTYCLRIYDKNNVEVYNSTLPPSINVVNSKVYVIYGTNLTEVISGQSVIRGQLLELQQELDEATRPEIVKIINNPPGIYSIYKKEGAIIGGTVLVCPALIVMAETTNETLVNGNENKTIYVNIPTSDHDNGTITVREDTLYLTGNFTWVNVSTGGGNFTNYTYQPNPIDLNGENISINITDNTLAYVKRVTEYQSMKKFYWTKYTDTLVYEATVDIENPMADTNNITKNIYVYMEFANDTTPKYETTTFYDVTNGEYLTRGTNFDTSSGGIHWYLTSLAWNTTRSFRARYTAEEGVVTPSNAVTVVGSYSGSSLGGESYWYIDADWQNGMGESFLGTLDVQFNFSTPYPIAPNSIYVYDEDNSRYLDRDEYSFHGGGITIIQSIIGTVKPGSTRNFGIYFLMTKPIEPQPSEVLINEGSNPLKTNLIGEYPIGFVIAIIFSIIGLIITVTNKKGVKNPIALLAWFFAFLLFVITL